MYNPPQDPVPSSVDVPRDNLPCADQLMSKYDLKVKCDKVDFIEFGDTNSFATYGVVRIRLNNIYFDLSFTINGYNRFNNLFDFTCNALCYSVFSNDDNLSCRLNDITVEKCIKDIKDHILVDISSCNIYHDDDDLHNYQHYSGFSDRIAKMVTYGYYYHPHNCLSRPYNG